MKTTNETAVEETMRILRTYWDENTAPAERAGMLRAAGEYDRDLRYMPPEGIEALAGAPFGALEARVVLALALAHLNEIEGMDREAEVAERRAGWSTTP